MLQTDNERVALALSDPSRYRDIVEAYQDKLLVYIRRISGLNHEDAQDILQDVFLKAYSNLNAFNTSLKFSSWIYRIAHNTTMSELRKRHVRPVYYCEEKDLMHIADSFDMHATLVAHETQGEIRTILETMDKKYGDILILKFLEEKDYKEISDILKIPEGTVATRINRAKKKFKESYASSLLKKT